jgi:hypothetical protein
MSPCQIDSADGGLRASPSTLPHVSSFMSSKHLYQFPLGLYLSHASSVATLLGSQPVSIVWMSEGLDRLEYLAASWVLTGTTIREEVLSNDYAAVKASD